MTTSAQHPSASHSPSPNTPLPPSDNRLLRSQRVRTLSVSRARGGVRDRPYGAERHRHLSMTSPPLGMLSLPSSSRREHDYFRAASLRFPFTLTQHSTAPPAAAPRPAAPARPTTLRPSEWRSVLIFLPPNFSSIFASQFSLNFSLPTFSQLCATLHLSVSLFLTLSLSNIVSVSHCLLPGSLSSFSRCYLTLFNPAPSHSLSRPRPGRVLGGVNSFETATGCDFFSHF